MRLADHVHLAVTGADGVLLDARDGVYYCLPEAGGHFVGDDIVDPDLAQTLEAAGLAIAAGSPRATRRAAPAARDLTQLEPPKPSRGEQLALARVWTASAGRYHGRSFAALIAQARRRAPSENLASDEDASTARRALVFARLLPWIPFQGVCLYRSFMLLAYLRAAGLDAAWVFGVRTWPFEAHCWLQHGDLVLDDTVDGVRGYLPILVV